MGDIYHKKGTDYYDDFYYAVPSLSTSDFTIEVTKDGASGSNTGITVTYVATNKYAIYVPASTGFTSVTGTYFIKINRTSIPTDVFTSIVRVTNDGTGAGTYGGATFTSATSDGRVTDGASALNGATVIVYLPSYAGIWSQTTTSATGNWGPVYFNANGTYPVIVQKAGYVSAVSSLQVVGSNVTGPGADITMAVSSGMAGTLTASSLWAYARRMYRDRTGTKADQELKEIVNEALMFLATFRFWPFLHTVGRVDFNAYYATGTATTVGGDATVTLSGGVWPSYAADAEVLLNQQWHRIQSRTSDTEIELVNAWHGTAYSGAFTLAQLEYDLPDDLLRLDQVVNRVNFPWGPDPVSRARLEVAKRQWRQGINNPALWAIERNRICIWPYSTSDQMVNLLYFRKPAELVNGTDIADWDSNCVEALRRCIDYMVSCRGDCVAGDRQQCYDAMVESVARATAADKAPADVKVGVPMGLLDPVVYPNMVVR